MNVTIRFHGPFRISTGAAAPGVDAAVDPDAFLPESSLKGVMRAAAVTIGVRRELIDAVFGTPKAASPWAWLPVRFDTSPVISRRARVPIDPATGIAVENGLLLAQEAWATSASFEIVNHAVLDAASMKTHCDVLAVAARGVRSIGANRNRGLGWVTLTSDHEVKTDDAIATLTGTHE
jgi:CRISPR/Cas system CSM-associated protein Csm3 (group 7 of RAMP superfamily)